MFMYIFIVTPEAIFKRKRRHSSSLKTAAEKEQSMSQEAGRPARRLYCVGENVERRNHYLNLAGIENYASKFDSTGIQTLP